MSKVKSGLGKGFGSLLPDDFDQSLLLDKKDRIQKIALSEINANPDQPRKHFDETALNELAISIKTYGILQPLVVTPSGDKYTIIAGERRWRAAKKAGLQSVPVLVRSHHELEVLEISLVENVQRVDLSPLEQAVSIAKLNEQFNITYEEIGKRLGKAHTTLINIVRLLKLPKAAMNALRQQKISEGHARTVLSLEGKPKLQQHLLDSIIEGGWSVRRAEAFARDAKAGAIPKARTSESKAKETDETKKLSKKLGSTVLIKQGKDGGQVQIAYKSQKDLFRILNLLLKGR